MDIPIYVEIGTQGGGSLEVAKNYFGERTRIYDIDVDPTCSSLNSEKFVDKVYIGDQGNVQFLDAIFKEIGSPDILVDDASHQPLHVITSFLTIFPKLNPQGTYLIEDTHCVYYSTHQELFYGLNVFDFFKSLADKLSLDFMASQPLIDSRFRIPLNQRQGTVQLKKNLMLEISSICFYNSIIVVEKCQHDTEPLRHVT